MPATQYHQPISYQPIASHAIISTAQIAIKAVLLSIISSAIFLVLASLAFAAGNDSNQQNNPTISASTANQLNKVNKLLSENAMEQARKQLRALIKKTQNKPYENGLAHQTMAYSYAMQDNYKTAIVHFEKALPLLSSSETMIQKTRFDLGQLYMAEERYRKAINILELWLKNTSKPNAQAHILLAQAYGLRKQNQAAIRHAKQAIQLEKKPRNNWYQLLLSLYLNEQQYRKAEPLLKKMIAYFPKNTNYWKQLANVQLQRKRNKQAVATLDIAWQQNILNKESELLNFANLLLSVRMPERAARLLQQEITNKRITANKKHWKLLANSYVLARENKKAIKAFEQAAQQSKDGQLYHQIAQLHVEEQNWPQAKKALLKAVKKGHLKRPGNSYLLLGIIEAELKEKEKARTAFKRALKYKKSKKAAQQWLLFLNTESA